MAHELKISARAEKSPIKTQNTFQIQGGSKLEVFDEDGGKLYEGEFKSFTSNFLKLLYGSMVGAGTAKVKDLSNSNVEMNALPQAWMNVQGGSGVKKFGLVVGTNSTSVSPSDYVITVPVSLTVNDTVVSASSVGADSISVEISRQISNSSGILVSLTEAGLICGLEDEVDSNVLIARDRLNVMLADGQKSTWRYTINFNFANDVGGFVKTFADNMFNGIFKEATSSAGWSARNGFGCIVYDNKMWVMGGNDGNSYVHDVWYSTDGITWTRATSSAGWSTRVYFGCIVYDNKMWVLGGYSGNSYVYDVWYSTNGITWTQATSSAAWSARAQFSCIVYDNKMWVMGGNNGNSYVHDVWYSTDGITWTRATSSAAWSARRFFGCIVYDNKMWVMGGEDSGGQKNDVWYSTDGITWTQATSSAVWSVRVYFGCIVYDNKMWVMGGNNGNSYVHDVWYSTDGITWTRATSSAAWSARAQFGCIVYDNKMWVMGGAPRVHDVWYLKSLITEIIVGSSASTFSPIATALGTEIANGAGSGELVYGTMPDPSTQEPTVSGNKTKMSIAREFTNNSGADITVREVGLFSGTDMLARLILANPVTILNGQSDVITVDFETEV